MWLDVDVGYWPLVADVSRVASIQYSFIENYFLKLTNECTAQEGTRLSMKRLGCKVYSTRIL